MVRRDDAVGLQRMRRVLVILIAAFLFLNSSPVSAQHLMSGCGFGWWPSAPPASGETLDLVCVASWIDPDLNADLVANEYTLRITGLVSTGPVNFGGGFYGINFNGGTAEFWRDPSGNASFGMSPPNATVPATFVDGTTYLNGFITSFFLFYDTNFEIGSFEGFVTFQSGEVWPLLHALPAMGFTIGGAFDVPGSNTPPGYQLATDFALDWEYVDTGPYPKARSATSDPRCSQTVHVDAATWTSVKHLYRD